MQLSGMDTVVLWHDRVPAKAMEIKTYAAARDIRVIWGFNWSWFTPVCLDSEEDACKWTGIVLRVLREEYMPLDPAGIYFQVGGTEFGGECRLNCPVCAKAAVDGVGPLFVKFAGSIIKAIKREYPGLYISAGVHLGGVHQSYEALRALDPSVQIMWEDLPGPGKHIEVPFAYDWGPDESGLQPASLEMVRKMCALRGPNEDVAFVVKGFPCHWGGQDPLLLDEFDLKALATIHQGVWDAAAQYCEKKLLEALEVFRVIADSPARSKTVVLLVEHGLWELRREYAAVLINEALCDPYREPQEVIAAARGAMNNKK